VRSGAVAVVRTAAPGAWWHSKDNVGLMRLILGRGPGQRSGKGAGLTGH
jgi:hypothetical protein